MSILGLPAVVVALIGVGVLVSTAAVVVVVPAVRRRRSRPAHRRRARPGPARCRAPRAAPPRRAADPTAGVRGRRRPGPGVAAAGPALPEAPPSRQARQQGAACEATTGQLDASPSTADGTGLPLLVTVGTIGGQPTVVSLGRAGLVALTGDRAVALTRGRRRDPAGSWPAPPRRLCSLASRWAWWTRSAK